MKMPNTKYDGSFIKGGPGENQSYKKYYGKMLQGFKRGGDVMPKRNKKNFRPTEKGAGMTEAGVKAYRRANPGSKLKTAVTGKVKPGSKAANRRKSYCARSAGQMKQFPKAAKDPNSRLRQARRRWKCQTDQFTDSLQVLTTYRFLQIVGAMRDTKILEAFSIKKEKEEKQKNLFRNLKKEVEIGANGTQDYIIKKGVNKGKKANVR